MIIRYATEKGTLSKRRTLIDDGGLSLEPELISNGELLVQLPDKSDALYMQNISLHIHGMIYLRKIM